MTYVEQKRLRVVAFHEGTQWVAQVLEHDLACQASTLSDLLHVISRITDAYMDMCKLKEKDPWEQMLPAPQEYVDMWEKAIYLRTWEQDLPKPVISIRVL